MIKYLEVFEQTIHGKNKVKVVIKRKDKPTPLIATCAPLDFGPKHSKPDGGDFSTFTSLRGSTTGHTS